MPVEIVRTKVDRSDIDIGIPSLQVRFCKLRCHPQKFEDVKCDFITLFMQLFWLFVFSFFFLKRVGVQSAVSGIVTYSYYTVNIAIRGVFFKLKFSTMILSIRKVYKVVCLIM